MRARVKRNEGCGAVFNLPYLQDYGGDWRDWFWGAWDRPAPRSRNGLNGVME
jgi:hypothetical protein